MAHVVLLGGGHANAQVLLALATAPPPRPRVTLVSELPVAYYSGMIPGCVAGQYGLEATFMRLDALCEWAGARFVRARGTGLRPDRRELETDAADPADRLIAYDFISVNIGSAVRGGCGPLCLSTRPISFLLRKLLLFEDTFFGDDPAFRRLRPVVPSLYYKRPAAADPEAKEAPPPPPPPPPPPAAPEFDDINRFAASLVAPGRRGGPVRVIVVGGGAAGVELAFCIQARLARYGAGVAPTVTIVDRAPVLLSEGGPALTRELEAALAERRITRRVGVECSRVERRDPGAPQITVTLSSGEQLEAELVLWATGAAPHAEFHNNSQLELDERGFLRALPTLQSTRFPNVFVSGDCASLAPVSPPKAGVYAVREGPIVAENLLRLLRNDSNLVKYEPQKGFLSLLNLGDGTAILSFKGFVCRNRAAFWLKDKIDQRFMDRFRVEKMGPPPR